MIRGVPWTLLGYVTNRVVMVVTTLVLARLLVPADFGLVALAILIVESLRRFTGLGVAPALVISPDLDRHARATALTLMVALGAGSAVLVAGISPLAADAFREPRLQSVLAITSVMLPLHAVGSFYEVVMQAELAFRRRFAALTIQTAGFATVALTLAALDAGVWSLVAGQIVGAASFASAAFWLSGVRVRPRLDMSFARELLMRGRGFIVQGGFSFLQQNADYIAVGRILGAGQLGLYSLAFRLSEIPHNALADPVAQVMFPGYARIRHRGGSLREPFLGIVRLIALVTFPIGVILAGAADPFVRAVLGEKWLGVIGPLSVLAIWGAIRPVQTMFGWLLNAIGRAGEVGLVSGAAVIVLIPSTVLAADLGGLVAVSWVMVANVLLFMAALALVTQKQVGIRLDEQWRAIWPVVVAAVASWGATRGVAELSSDMSAAAGLVVSVAAGATAYLTVISVVAPGWHTFVLRQLRRAVGRGEGPRPPVEVASSSLSPRR